MFPLPRSGELCFKISSNPNHQAKIAQDPSKIVDTNNAASSAVSPDPLDVITRKVHVPSPNNKGDMKMRGPRKINTTYSNGEESGSGGCGGEDGCSRKKRHREVEKQRRQEMASLFAGLRSLLPLEFIRGKRSIADHMNEGVNYIRHLQSKIKELEAKRDELKRTSNPTCPDSKYGIRKISSNSDLAPNSSVDVHHWCGGGTQVIISRDLNEEVFPLSVVMELLSQEGLNIVSCLSSQVKDRTLHKIYCEAAVATDDTSGMNLTELREKLEGVIG